MSWESPPIELVLQEGQVHLWRAALDQPPSSVERLEATLAPDERARAARFHFERDRSRFIAGRGILREILGRYLAEEPARIQLAYGEHGKPRLSAPAGGARLEFNLSHTRGLALYAITRRSPIGVDVEYLRPVPDAARIVDRFFSECEQADYRRLSAEVQLIGFFNAWTRKEAYVKALGLGLGYPLHAVEVSMAPGAAVRFLRIDGNSLAAGWSLIAVSPAPGYTAAVAVAGDQLALQHWQWSLVAREIA
jgi:4'-phosphopantetheinyl transferase